MSEDGNVDMVTQFEAEAEIAGLKAELAALQKEHTELARRYNRLVTVAKTAEANANSTIQAISLL